MAKCLIMVKAVLSSIFECRSIPFQSKRSVPRGIHPILLELLESLVLPSVLHKSPEVRKQAVCCLGVGCMFSAALATRHFALLVQVSILGIF